MNIIYLSAYDQPNGQSTRTYDFSRELVRLGHEVTIFTNSYCHFTHRDFLGPHEKWRIEIIDGIKVVWLKTIKYKGNGLSRGLNMLSNVYAILKSSKSVITIKPDIVIGPSVPLLTAWAAWFLSKRYKTQFVFEVRDIWPQSLVEIGAMKRNSIIYFSFRKLEKFLYKKASKISVVLPYAANHIADSGFPKKEVTWIPNGINVQSNIPITFNSNHIGAPLIVTYLGGYSFAHDISTLINAIKLVEMQGPSNIRFQFYGSGQFKNQAILEAKSLGLDSIVFFDRVPKSQVADVLLISDILLASLKDLDVYKNGINLNKIFDYMQSSRPIIFAANVPNDPVKDSGCGISVAPGNPQLVADAITTLANIDSRKRREMGGKGRKYFEHNYSIEMLAKRMEAMLLGATLCEQLIDERT